MTRVRFHWGVGIGLCYLLFAGATLAFVVFAIAQPVELVSADYYERSLTYDQRLEAKQAAEALGDAVGVSRSDDGRALIVRVPRARASSSGEVSGALTFYRPSDVGADRVVPLRLDANGVQRVSLDGLASGRWILEMAWQAQGRHYYREEAVHLP
jgi:nitrogen fixation protein FixH